MSGHASSLEKLPMAEELRQHRQKLQSRRLVGTGNNRPLVEILADRGYAGDSMTGGGFDYDKVWADFGGYNEVWLESEEGKKWKESEEGKKWAREYAVNKARKDANHADTARKNKAEYEKAQELNKRDIIEKYGSKENYLKILEEQRKQKQEQNQKEFNLRSRERARKEAPVLAAFGDAGMAVVDKALDFIPVVGQYGKEGIEAFKENRAYDPGKATVDALIDGAFSLIPGGKAVKGVAKTGAKVAVKQAVKKGIKDQIKGAVKGAIKGVVKKGLKETAKQTIKDQAKGAVKGALHKAVKNAFVGEGKRIRKKKAGTNDKRRKRGAIISRLMKTEGMTLGQASRYIKENGLMY